MSAVAEWDIDIYQGSTWRIRFKWVDMLGFPMDLTGYGARMQVRKHEGASALISIDSDQDEIVTDEEGHIDVTIPAVKTQGEAGIPLDFKRAEWDIFLYPNNADRTVYPVAICEGIATYTKKKTQPA